MLAVQGYAAGAHSATLTPAGDPEALHLWAGTGYQQAATGLAADVLRTLAGSL